MSGGRVAARMQAWRVHAYGGELRLESARVPALRAPDDVLVAVRAAALNPLDVGMVGGYGRRVLNTLRALEGGGVEFPLVPGRDFAGEVVRAGPAARLRPGDRAWGVLPPHRPGALAQFVLVSDRWAGPAPRSLDVRRAGGTLYAALSACAALRAAGLWPAAAGGAEGAGGARVLLLGLGGVGQAALQLLRHVGAEVVVGCAPDQTERALALGAALALDRRAPDYERRLEESGPYAAVLDAAGRGGAEAGARRWRFARYVTLTSPLLRDTDEHGLAGGALAAAAALLRHELAAAPAASSACPPRVRWAFFGPRAEDVERLRRLADGGELAVHVERAFPWEEAAEALAQAARGHARGKIVVDVAPA
ncbi:reticulon-4-interacting protein 1, mitochondrial-like [Aricia agestis]|uniref:reticulon-4-interacting protein 1, mitochondrial-like n=1 Tax=Aricia agestis TaxID=91739 RepID=UPI001C206EDC|nr:reticulon-4-interacting protein 1, mitochondrial-like [Aricia agestis]XP_041987431.1 reticulon-4-interacting protein 1, mitochondrial-like [Aricia agestis]